MKKNIRLLVLVLAAFTHSCFAQPGTSCNPDFNVDISSNGYQVQFTPLRSPGSGVTMDYWEFGDGQGAYSQVPSSATPEVQLHNYGAPGTYNVYHRVYRYDTTTWTVTCADSIVRSVTTFMPAPCNIHAAFDFSRDSSFNNVVYFKLDSLPPPSSFVKWDFGDGTTGYQYNPVHTYNSSGLYNVCVLISRDSLCRDSVCHPVQVQVSSVPICNAAFTNSITNNLVQFTSTSTPNQFYEYHNWDFGDGTYDYTYSASPLHVYQSAGTFAVTHTVTKYSDNFVLCRDSVMRTVTITNLPCNLHAEYNYYRDSIQTNKVYFNNISTGATPNTFVKWSFGDGTFSYDNNPVHIYPNTGVYNVCLLVKKDSLCASDTCNTIDILAPNTCNLLAGFDSRPDSLNPMTVHFTNLSLPFDPTDSVWYTFGDGLSSSDINPTHTYTAPGTYNVCIRVKKVTLPGVAPCVREFCRTIILQQADPCDFVTSFTFYSDTLTGGNPNMYHFSNTTTPLSNSDSSFWDFGDGTPVLINPNNSFTHTYTSPGVYVVCLSVKKISNSPIPDFCIRQECQTLYIPAPCTITPDFYFYFDTVNQAPRYHFSNGSVPLNSTDSSFWSFGDGTYSHDSNPLHTFPAPGTYIVCLTVKQDTTNTVPACERQICKTIIVPSLQPAACNLSVDFSTGNDSANRRKIFFTNLSNSQPGQAIANWTFGDGHVGNSWNADHIYAQPGQYTVCLKVSLNNTCIKDTCKIITVQPSADSCNIQVGFVSRIDSANRRKVYFINTTAPLNSAAVASWTFGDGHVGNSWNADHIYAQPGRYAVCLTVTRGNDCTRVWCDSVFVPGSSVPPAYCDTAFLEHFYRRDGYMPNMLFFFAVANGPVLQQSWTFTRLPNGVPVTVNQSNPVHIFGDTGTYRVCLKGILWGNCIKEYCDTVSIYSTSAPSQCMLQPYPNPAHNQVSVNLHLQQPELITASVYSIQNVLLLQQTQQGFTGNNLVTINIPNLVPGYYSIRLVHGNQVCYARFQKL